MSPNLLGNSSCTQKLSQRLQNSSDMSGMRDVKQIKSNSKPPLLGMPLAEQKAPFLGNLKRKHNPVSILRCLSTTVCPTLLRQRGGLWAEGCFCIKADRCGWLKATPPLPTGSCAALAALHRQVFSGAFKYLL